MGIKPIEKNYIGHESRYTIEDAHKILSYSTRYEAHSIIHFNNLETILSTEKLRKDLVSASILYEMNINKLKSMVEEYEKSGCFIATSKVNKLDLNDGL
ncbi:MAG TPA: hypothetical protein VIV55_09985 [Flavobacterium sp.]